MKRTQPCHIECFCSCLINTTLAFQFFQLAIYLALPLASTRRSEQHIVSKLFGYSRWPATFASDWCLSSSASGDTVHGTLPNVNRADQTLANANNNLLSTYHYHRTNHGIPSFASQFPRSLLPLRDSIIRFLSSRPNQEKCSVHFGSRPCTTSSPHCSQVCDNNMNIQLYPRNDAITIYSK